MYYLFCWCLGSSEWCINPKGIDVLSETKEKKGKGWLPTLLKSHSTFHKQFQSMASFSSLCWVKDDVLGLAIDVKNFWYMSFPFLSQGQMHVQCTHTLWSTCSLNHPLTKHTTSFGSIHMHGLLLQYFWEIGEREVFYEEILQKYGIFHDLKNDNLPSIM